MSMSENVQSFKGVGEHLKAFTDWRQKMKCQSLKGSSARSDNFLLVKTANPLVEKKANPEAGNCTGQLFSSRFSQKLFLKPFNKQNLLRVTFKFLAGHLRHLGKFLF